MAIHEVYKRARKKPERFESRGISNTLFLVDVPPEAYGTSCHADRFLEDPFRTATDIPLMKLALQDRTSSRTRPFARHFANRHFEKSKTAESA